MLHEDEKKGWNDKRVIDKDTLKIIDKKNITPSEGPKTPKTTGDGTIDEPYVPHSPAN